VDEGRCSRGGLKLGPPVAKTKTIDQAFSNRALVCDELKTVPEMIATVPAQDLVCVLNPEVGWSGAAL